MPQYFFQLRTQNAAPYPHEARDLPDLRTALAEAQSIARSLIHNRVRRAPIELHASLEIADEGRRPVARVLLADVARQIS